MNHNGTSNHRPFVVRERDLMVHIFQRRLSRSVRLYVSHIAQMPFGCVGSCVGFVGRIKMGASRTRIGCAAITELMDMKSMIARSQAGDFRVDLYPIGLFGESNRAPDFAARGGMKHRDSFQGCRRFFCRSLGMSS